MEFGLPGGVVRMLHFRSGHPVEGRGAVRDLVQEAAVVAAWMPARDQGPEDNSADITARVKLLRSLEVTLSADRSFHGMDAWAVVTDGAEMLATSPGSLPAGLASLLALVAEINAGYGVLMGSRDLDRAAFQFELFRIGFEPLGAARMLVYRIQPQQQAALKAVLNAVHLALRQNGFDPAAPGIGLRAASPVTRHGEYFRWRPSLFESFQAMVHTRLD